jgi:diaminopimelate epimerase
MNALVGVAFEKWEGLGNDFVIIELPHDAPIPFAPEVTRLLCDRHRGIGADGILFIAQSSSGPRMIVSNADGSRPEMCGNGLRCVAAYLASRSAENTTTTLIVATDAGDKQCFVERLDDHYAVTVDMGTAKQSGPLHVPLTGKTHSFTTIDIGNPHAITFDPAYTQSDIDIVGPTIATSVPGGTNVEFCQVVSEGARPRIDVTVWERGVGRTLACGTGACAVAAAACDARHVAFEEPVDVALPGGILEITVHANRTVQMKGPARRVFHGEVKAG